VSAPRGDAKTTRPSRACLSTPLTPPPIPPSPPLPPPPRSARNNVIYTSSVRTASAADDFDGAEASAPAPAPPALVDGERLPLSEKELGSVELFPQHVSHNPNGRFVAVAGDNEFVIYTSQALRNKTFGAALDFAWSASGVGDYAVRESTSSVKLFKNFKETRAFRPAIAADGISGGALFCVRSADTLCFYDWDSGALIRRIEVAARAVYWNEEGTLVCVAGDDALYVLRYSAEVAQAAIASNAPGIADEGVEAAFELQHEVADKVRSGLWVGDCFIYTNSGNRLNYYVGGEVITFAHLDRRMYLLGYLAKEGRVFLIDKTCKLVSYGLSLAVLEYQTAVVRKDFGAANRILADVPRDQHNSIAKFLEGQGYKEQALAVAEDPDLKFDLALQLRKLDVAYALLTPVGAAAAAAAGSAAPAAPASDIDSSEQQAKWRQLMDLALATSNIPLAEECAVAARDLGALLLIHSSLGNEEGLLRVAAMAEEEGRDNIAFLAYSATGHADKCEALLLRGGRELEASCLRTAYGLSSSPAPAPAEAGSGAAAPSSASASSGSAPASPAKAAGGAAAVDEAPKGVEVDVVGSGGEEAAGGARAEGTGDGEAPAAEES
jgi:coatomer subunit beta'